MSCSGARTAPPSPPSTSSFPIVTDGAITGSVITFSDTSVRQGARKRLAVQYAVSRVLAGSAALDAAPTRILAAIGSGFALDVGLFWRVFWRVGTKDDDDPEARERLHAMLTRDGWRVATAGNGREALDMVARGMPSLVLLDLMMPEMDGFAFFQALRARPDGRHVPVVVHTAKDVT